MAPSQIFISHASADDEFPQELRGRLEGYGLVVWTDSRELRGGDELDPTISRAIEQARAVLVVLSPQTIDSPWVRKEVELALAVERRRAHDGYRVIPLLLPGVDRAALALWFGEERVGIRVGLGAGELSAALPAILAALGMRLPDDPAVPAVLGLDDVDFTDRSIDIAKGFEGYQANGDSGNVRDIGSAPQTPGTPASQPAPKKALVNIGFALPAQADAPILPTMPLACDQLYYLWLEIGALLEGSIEESPVPLPIDRLPSAARLQVVLFAFPGELQIQPGADIGELQNLADQSVRVTRAVVQPTGLPTGSDLPARRLFFPVRTSARAGTFRLRCNIYYEQILVQSRVVYARVMRRPHPVERALRSVCDYTLTHSLHPALLSRAAPHRLSIMLNANGDGTHGFRFFGEQEFKNDASFDGQELEDLITQARGALRMAAWGDEAPWQAGKRYLYDGPRDLERLRADLVRFAIRGYRIYDAIINRLAGDADQADALATLMNEPGLVQIAMKEAARYVLPAALIYDYGLDTSAEPAAYTLCPTFLAGLAGAAPLEQLACFKGACPSRGADTVICPSGFWGYRHSLGLPLSVATAPDAPPEIVFQGGPQVAVGVSTDKNFTRREAHEQVLKKLHPKLDWKYAETRDKTFEVLKQAAPHLVYFYCHGGVANTIPFIQVGALTERGITRDNLRYKKIRWAAPRPLVFINGCHTTALEPEIALELVSAFVENAYAAGVIGTEITIFEPLACAFAEECLRRFMAGIAIGQAVREARLALLKAGNPLGLTYIPFVIAGMRLIEHPGDS